MAQTTSLPEHLEFVLTVEPETSGRRWRALLVQQVPGSPDVRHEFDNPVELARYVAQVSIPSFSSGGLR
jgi:hypothetical protein